MGKGVKGMRKYETVDSLFVGICDAIREKDGTTAMINHQDIPDRIMGIQVGGGVNERYYIYKSGEELNGHGLTLHGTTNSRKTDGWIFMHYFYAQKLTSDLVQKANFHRIGITILADATVFSHPTRITQLLLRDSNEVIASGNDYIFSGGTTYFTGNIIQYPNTANQRSGTFIFDIPQDVEEFYIGISNVNVNSYIEEIWLEK